MRKILRFAFVVIPTAALASAVVFAVSHNGGKRTAAADGDLQRDLQLASTSNLDLTPTTAVAPVSAIEEAPAAAPQRSTRPKRNPTGPRAVRSRNPVVRAAPDVQVAAATEDAQPSEMTTPAPAVDATADAPAQGGGVALPRPTAVPVSYPAAGTGSDVGSSGAGSRGSGDGSGGILGGIFGAILRGGTVDGDNCQEHPDVYRRRPVYRSPNDGLGGSRIRDRIIISSRPTQTVHNSGSLMERVRANRRGR